MERISAVVDKRLLTLSREMRQNWETFGAPQSDFVKSEHEGAKRNLSRGLEQLWELYDSGIITARLAENILEGKYYIQIRLTKSSC